MPYWQVERQETLCHWQHSCLFTLFFLFIDWEYYLPLHPAVYTSLATEIYHWLLGNMSIRARGYFCWAVGQKGKLGGSQVTSTHCDFRHVPGSFFDSTGFGSQSVCPRSWPFDRTRSIFSHVQSLFDVTFFTMLHQSVWSAKNKSVLAETPYAL